MLEDVAPEQKKTAFAVMRPTKSFTPRVMSMQRYVGDNHFSKFFNNYFNNYLLYN